MQWQLWFNLHGSSSSKVNLHSRVDLKAMETLSSHITNYLVLVNEGFPQLNLCLHSCFLCFFMLPSFLFSLLFSLALCSFLLSWFRCLWFHCLCCCCLFCYCLTFCCFLSVLSVFVVFVFVVHNLVVFVFVVFLMLSSLLLSLLSLSTCQFLSCNCPQILDIVRFSLMGVMWSCNNLWWICIDSEFWRYGSSQT